jgi:predicted dehydrogenase
MEANKTRKVRWAVVGLGNVAEVVPAFDHAKESSQLVALISSAGTYDELEQVIEDAAVEAVYVAVPSSLHREMTERAARAGANVLCEKPMATTSADCEAMIEACEDAGVKLMIAYRLHFEAANLREIGEPRIFASVFARRVADVGGGALLDMGIYCVNAARHVFQAEPLSVVAMQTVGFRHVDEMTSVVMRFPGDRIAQFTASQGVSDVGELRVVGTKGDIELGPAFEHAGKLEDEIAHFSNCITRDATPEPSAREALADVRIIEAIIRSAATREVVQIPAIERTSRPRASTRRRRASDHV